MSTNPKSSGTSLVVIFTLGLIGMLVFGISSLAGTATESYAHHQKEIEKINDIRETEAKAEVIHEQGLIDAKVAADLAAASPVASADKEAGKAKYMICATCHGANGEGNPALKGPSLVDQDATYMLTQLKHFKTGVRGSDPAKDMQGFMMAAQAKMLSDDDMKNVTAYILTLKGKPVHSLKGDAAAGKAKYATCLACHGVNGEGNPAMKSPSLTGLPDWYIVTQLKNFKSGARGGDAAKDANGAIMAMQSKALTEKDMKDVAEYIKTLKK